MPKVIKRAEIKIVHSEESSKERLSNDINIANENINDDFGKKSSVKEDFKENWKQNKKNKKQKK